MASTNLNWYATCGDPVCGGHRDTGTPACTTEKTGDACTLADKECDPVNMCNSHLRCTDKDPKQQLGGCPLSRRRFRDDIACLTSADLSQTATATLVPKPLGASGFLSTTTPIAPPSTRRAT